MPPIVAASTRSVPTIEYGHEKETNAKVNAIKKIPINPPLFDAESALFIQELGSVISNAPIKDTAKTTKSKRRKY